MPVFWNGGQFCERSSRTTSKFPTKKNLKYIF
jgi:hypothetical protein